MPRSTRSNLRTALISCAEAWLDQAERVMTHRAETMPTALVCVDEAVRTLALAQEWGDGDAGVPWEVMQRLLEVRGSVERWGREDR